MPRPGIPPALEQAVLAEAGKGRSQREIAAWLKAEHRVGVTHVTVGKLLKRIRDELGETTRAVAVNELAPQVVGDIGELNGVLQRARAIEDGAAPDPKAKGKAKKGSPAIALKALELQRKVLHTKLHFAGADGSPEDAQNLADLMALAFR